MSFEETPAKAPVHTGFVCRTERPNTPSRGLLDMKWRKLGRIFCAAGEYPWMRTHAANPIAESLEGSLVRIYFNCRDDANRAHVAWLLIDLEQPHKILGLSRQPAFSPGPRGAFDDRGVSIGCLVTGRYRTLLYYVGWNLGRDTPWRNAIGLAEMLPEATGEPVFARIAPGPILDRDPHDPYNLSYPWIIGEAGAWKMWYGTNLAPMPDDLRDIPHALKLAESEDGVDWRRYHQSLCLGGDLRGDCAFTRPCVIRDGDLYRMWYCHRGEVYTIGYAESHDGLHWTRKDEQVGIAPSRDGWDADSLSYPSVFDHGSRRYMLYNGPRHGATGFGLAVLEHN